MSISPSGPAAPPELRRFLDGAGRLAQWPARRRLQLVVLPWLASWFERGRDYHEREVNDRLREAHTFGDWALLRRELVDGGYLEREADGSRYRRTGRGRPAGE